MVAINQKSFLGDFTPDVNIKKIILETTSQSSTFAKSPQSSANNPHIRNKTVGGFNMGGIANEGITISADETINKFADEAYKLLHKKGVLSMGENKAMETFISDNPALYNTEDIGTTLQISLKEKMNGNSAASWLSNVLLGDGHGLLDFLKIRVVQCTSAETTQKILAGSLIIGSDEYMEIMYSGPIGMLQEERFLLRDRLEEEPDEKKPDAFKGIIEYDDDGNKFQHILFEWTNAPLSSISSSTSHLSYFVFAFIDFSDLAELYDLQLSFMNSGPQNVKAINGKISSEVVISDGKVNPFSTTFYDSVGRIWTGQVHQLPSGKWMTSADSTSTPGTEESLIAKKTPNFKIQDMRSLNKIFNKTIKFDQIKTILEKELSNPDVAIRNPSPCHKVLKNNYFTDFFSSKDQNGNCRFFFGIDIYNIMRDHMRYPKFLDINNAVAASIMGQSHIIDIKLFRKKVREEVTENELTQAVNKSGAYSLDKNQIPELIALLNPDVEKTPPEQPLISVDNLSFDMTFSSPTTTDQIIYFQGIDSSAKNGGESNYQYIVELEMQDGSIQWLSEQLMELRDAYSGWKSLIEEAKIPSFRQTTEQLKNTLQSPHIEDWEYSKKIEEESFHDATIKMSGGNYDYKTNTFTQDFIKRAAGVGVNSYAARAMTAVATLHSTMEYVFGVPPGVEGALSPLLNIFWLMAHPKTATIETLLLFENLMAKVLKVLEDQIGDEASTTSTFKRTGKTSSGTMVKSPRRIFKIEKTFPTIFKSNLNVAGSQAGYNYFGSMFQGGGGANHGLASSGLVTYTASQYFKRVTKEVLKYFKNYKVDPSLAAHPENITSLNDSLNNTALTYLSPIAVSLPSFDDPHEIVDVPSGKEAFDPDVYSKLVTKIMIYNSLKKSPQIPIPNFGLSSKSKLTTDQQNIKAPLVAMSADENMMITPVTKIANSFAIIDDFLVTNNQKIGVGEYVGKESKFLQEDFILDEFDDLNLDSQKSKEEDSNPNSLLLTLQKDKIFGTEFSATPLALGNKFQSPAIATIQQFNLNSTNNILTAIKAKLPPSSDTADIEPFSSTVPPNRFLNNFIINLPNQLKSLFLSSTDPESVNYNWFSSGLEEDSKITQRLKLDNMSPQDSPHVNPPPDPMQHASLAGAFYFNYGRIMRVEVLTGFAKTTNGRSLQRPVWVPLNFQEFENNSGNIMVCRLKQYINNLLPPPMSTNSKSLDLPTFNEIFILETVMTGMAGSKSVAFESMMTKITAQIKEFTDLIDGSQIEYSTTAVTVASGQTVGTVGGGAGTMGGGGGGGTYG